MFQFAQVEKGTKTVKIVWGPGMFYANPHEAHICPVFGISAVLIYIPEAVGKTRLCSSQGKYQYNRYSGDVSPLDKKREFGTPQDFRCRGRSSWIHTPVEK